MIAWLLTLATLGAALRSAWYWYRSSQISAVPYWEEVGADEPKDQAMSQAGRLNALIKANGESAWLNRWGAIWTAGTVILGAMAMVASVVG
jgi:hypothetical protein